MNALSTETIKKANDFVTFYEEAYAINVEFRNNMNSSKAGGQPGASQNICVLLKHFSDEDVKKLKEFLTILYTCRLAEMSKQIESMLK